MNEFHYSSFFDEDITNLKKVLTKFRPENIILVFDTNICIYLRDFYNNPLIFKTRKEGIYNSLISLLKTVYNHKIEIFPDFGIEEASRNKEDFSKNTEKEKEIAQAVFGLLDMSPQELINFGRQFKFSKPVKDLSNKTDSKKSAMNQSNSIIGLPLFYAYMLKAYLLENCSNISSRVEKMKKFIDFMAYEVDCITAIIYKFGYHYFNGLFKKMIENNGDSIEDVIHSIWNGAIDLSFPYLAGVLVEHTKKVPVFVTNDNRLYMISKGLTLAALLLNGNSLAPLPQFTKIDLATASWDLTDMEEVESYYKKIQLSVVISRKRDKPLDKDFLKGLCSKLEDEVKRHYYLSQKQTS